MYDLVIEINDFKAEKTSLPESKKRKEACFVLGGQELQDKAAATIVAGVKHRIGGDIIALVFSRDLLSPFLLQILCLIWVRLFHIVEDQKKGKRVAPLQFT